MSPTRQDLRRDLDVERSVAIWVDRLSRGRPVSREDLEDLAQAARIGAWRAGLTWRGDAGAARSTWVINAIRHAIQEELRRQDHLTRWQRHEVAGLDETPTWALRPASLDALQEEEATALAALLTPAGAVEEEAMRQIEVARVRGAVAELPARWRERVRMRYLEETPRNECARRLGISTTALAESLRYAQRRLWTRLHEEESCEQAAEADRGEP